METLTPGDGYADPTVQSLAKGCSAVGVTIRRGTEVLGFAARANGPVVMLDEQTLPFDWIVVSAGIWSSQLAISIGLSLPVEPSDTNCS
jgi:glycine/D-amino acid oxidase-like deaminating enzyme